MSITQFLDIWILILFEISSFLLKRQFKCLTYFFYESRFDSTLTNRLYQNNKKCLFSCVYKPLNQNDTKFLNKIGAISNHYLKNHDNVIIIRDFNMTVKSNYLLSMIQAYDLDNLVKRAVCFQAK